jgi:hypothetical protein
MSTNSNLNSQTTNRVDDGSRRKAAIIVGALILLATATFMAGDGLITAVLSGPDYLSQVYGNRIRLISGVFLEFIDAIAIVGVGVVIYPILKKHNEAIATGYVATRIIECVVLFISGLSLLLLVPLSQAYLQAGSPDSSTFQTLADLLVTHSGLAFQLAMLALSLGSIPFCYLLFQSNLIPRWMSLLGLIGYAALAVGMILGIFGIADTTQGFGLIAMAPGGIFELVLPFWLFAKGFNTLERN